MSAPDLSGAAWRKSRYSQQNGACVEVAFMGEAVAMRDSKNQGGTVLFFDADKWTEFVAGVQAEAFNVQ
ncbi:MULTISPECIES: DUF397 domain-containing protein [unclassified Streptomyces]|uniref:DUF397 domain-containing protein n=1 Tax=unclassified Streptomyces TaxID=2593676 RepID=UPI002E2D9A62|nr:DUF397 domain-containing protein [Streptomyces sp. NBC_00223]